MRSFLISVLNKDFISLEALIVIMDDQVKLLKNCGEFSLTLWCLQLFQRCLVKVLSIDLWKLYLNYIKDTKGKLPSYRYVQ